jgi:hypothetical protein
MFYCDDTKCPNYLTMPLYCMLCCQLEPDKHNHTPKFIAVKGDTSKADWQNLRSKGDETLRKAKDWFEKHGALVNILSNEEHKGNAKLKSDHQELIALNANINKYYKDEIDTHLLNDNIVELQRREPKFKEFTSVLTRLDYLGSIAIKDLWKHFWAPIPWVPLNQVFALSEDSIALFSRLKLISVQSRLHVLQSTNGEEEVKEGDAANDELIIQLISSGENTSLDSLFTKNRQMFSQVSKKVTNVKYLAQVEYLRHEFEGFDYRLQAH